jgi:hypothetical protein
MLCEMKESTCPYLVCEKMAFRESLDLSEGAPVSIVVTWYCRHPFHGIRVELGDARREVEKICAACSLLQRPPDGGADCRGRSAPEDQPDGAHGGPEQRLGEEADHEHAGCREAHGHGDAELR